MPTEVDPVPGEWYVKEDDGERFQVQGLDQEQDMLEIMHDSGRLEELPLQRWYEMSVVPAVQPMTMAGPTSEGESSDDYGSEADLVNPENDPAALKPPSEDDVYRRRNVEYANKAPEGYPGDKSESDEEGWGADDSVPRNPRQP